MKILVTGAAGFIGHHLVNYLAARGHTVIGADVARPEYETRANWFYHIDLRNADATAELMRQSYDRVYALAANMGGMGFISKNHATILYDNALINLNTIDEAARHSVGRLLFASSACVYPRRLQDGTLHPTVFGGPTFDAVSDVLTPSLREDDAYPADPEDAYGWEKLTAEKACQYYREEKGLDTRVVRFHNIFGPEGTWRGGREKAPAALCRKVAEAKLNDERHKIQGPLTIDVWGDGQQTRSFCYVDDCLRGLELLMESDRHEPTNLGQDRAVSIDELVSIVADAASRRVEIQHVDGPQGVRGRNSDNSRIYALGWKPEVTLEEGIARTYAWIDRQVRAQPW